MLKRVERIMRVKRLNFNNDELFGRRKDFEEKNHNGTFASIFEDEVEKKKKRIEDDRRKKNEAYSLDVGRPTQSLFYQGKADISGVHGKFPIC